MPAESGALSSKPIAVRERLIFALDTPEIERANGELRRRLCAGTPGFIGPVGVLFP